MTSKNVVNFWQSGADDAMETAKTLMDSGKYHHSLFFCHLAVEKMLKAKVVAKTQKPALPSHNLLQLAQYARLDLSQTRKDQLREINRFNIEARYDDYKLRFYKKATREFAVTWFKSTQDLLLWLGKS